MSTPPIHLDYEAQTMTAFATTLGLLTILIEELARTRAVDAGRLMDRFDDFARSASVAAGTSSQEAQYVAQLVEMVKGGLAKAGKERGDGERG